MVKDVATKRYSVEELETLRAAGGSRTDHARLRAQTDADVEQAAAGDPDWEGVSDDWYRAAQAVMPGPKRLLSLRLDEDVLSWFRAQGPGYQTRINAVLRAFVVRQRG